MVIMRLLQALMMNHRCFPIPLKPQQRSKPMRSTWRFIIS